MASSVFGIPAAVLIGLAALATLAFAIMGVIAEYDSSVKDKPAYGRSQFMVLACGAFFGVIGFGLGVPVALGMGH